jgi:biotin carboxylase
VRVLLTDGSGLTARQVATRLHGLGHRVEVLCPDPFSLTRFTRHVAHVHKVPPYGDDPFAWLDAALAVVREHHVDVLFPTQEQVAVLACEVERVRALGVALAVPSFDALRRVQDKLAAFATLMELGVPQPHGTVARTPADLLAVDDLPVFVKVPIGTATSGIRRAAAPSDLRAIAAELERADAFSDGGVLVQRAVDGPLAMVQAVFSDGRLLASHANLRTREGASGGASGKRSVDLPEVREQLTTIGAALRWHGAFSADVVLTDDGPRWIDLNPRLVEPGNAFRAGVDLVDVLLRVSIGEPPAPVPPGRPGVDTHQLVLALLAAAGDGRGAILRELRDAARHHGPYGGSTEELTPLAGDARTALPVAFTAVALLARPSLWRELSGGAVRNYALSAAGWRAICAACGPDGDAPR